MFAEESAKVVMIRDAAALVITGALGLAFLGLIGICMVRDTIKEIDVGTPDKR